MGVFHDASDDVANAADHRGPALDRVRDQDQPQVSEIYRLVYDINTGNDYPIFEGELDSNAGRLLGGCVFNNHIRGEWRIGCVWKKIMV